MLKLTIIYPVVLDTMIFVVYCTIGYMKKILLNIAIYIALLTIYLTFTSPALAYVTVGSYYRNNGTYVRSEERRVGKECRL